MIVTFTSIPDRQYPALFFWPPFTADLQVGLVAECAALSPVVTPTADGLLHWQIDVPAKFQFFVVMVDRQDDAAAEIVWPAELQPFYRPRPTPPARPAASPRRVRSRTAFPFRFV